MTQDPTLGERSYCTERYHTSTRRTQYRRAQPHRLATGRGEGGQFGVGEAALRPDDQQEFSRCR